MSVTWYAMGHYEGKGNYINDAAMKVESTSIARLSSLSLTAHFGSGYTEKADHGPVAVLPFQVYAKCQGLWQTQRIFLRGALFGNWVAVKKLKLSYHNGYI